MAKVFNHSKFFPKFQGHTKHFFNLNKLFIPQSKFNPMFVMPCPVFFNLNM